jgi:hypothetical protein
MAMNNLRINQSSDWEVTNSMVRSLPPADDSQLFKKFPVVIETIMVINGWNTGRNGQEYEEEEDLEMEEDEDILWK